jgi:hypothetical protein
LRTFAIVVLVLLTGSAFAAKEAPELQQLRDQLKKAQDAEDKPAIIELSRRIVGIAPNDPGTWDTLAQTQRYLYWDVGRERGQQLLYRRHLLQRSAHCWDRSGFGHHNQHRKAWPR